MTSPSLVQAVTDAMPPDNGIRVGKVDSLGPFRVNLAGGLIPAGILNSYVPAVGDQVALIRQDQTWLAIGRIGSADMAYPTFANLTMDNPSFTITSGSFATFTGSEFNLSKASSGSVIESEFQTASFLSVAGNTAIEISIVLVGTPGTFEFVIGRYFQQLATHTAWGGSRALAGVPAGDYNCRLRGRRVSGTPNPGWNSADYVTLNVKEV